MPCAMTFVDEQRNEKDMCRKVDAFLSLFVYTCNVQKLLSSHQLSIITKDSFVSAVPPSAFCTMLNGTPEHLIVHFMLSDL